MVGEGKTDDGICHNSPTYYERFREAFVAEVNAFADSVLDDTGEY
jgi:hypothetical protein